MEQLVFMLNVLDTKRKAVSSSILEKMNEINIEMVEVDKKEEGTTVTYKSDVYIL